jgi:predicted amidohydrolase YtcJ
MTATSSLTADLVPGRSVVFRNATVLTLNDAHDVLDGADVLVTGERIAAVGPNLAVPEGTAEIDAAGGILMPGMIDTHRHMWQTAMRGYGADWTLTQARQVIEQTVEYLQGQLGPAAWTEGMHPEIPETKVLDNPYTYTEWDAGSAQWKGTADSDPSA